MSNDNPSQEEGRVNGGGCPVALECCNGSAPKRHKPFQFSRVGPHRARRLTPSSVVVPSLGFRSPILLWQNRFANCEVRHTQELNFTLASGDQAEAPMQTKPRIHNTVRDLERSPKKPMMWARRPEKPIMWARRAMIALVLVCGSYFIVDIVRILKEAYGS